MSEHDGGEEAPDVGEQREQAADPGSGPGRPQLDDVDQNSLQSFPASDPPASSGTT